MRTKITARRRRSTGVTSGTKVKLKEKETLIFETYLAGNLDKESREATDKLSKA
jgi:hypothetical protein